MKPPTLSDASAVYDHVLAESGSREVALWAAMRMYSVTPAERLERDPTRYVLEAVCERFGVALQHLLGRHRTARVARARLVAIALLHGAGGSYREAGGAVGRSKAGAVRACARVERDPVLAAEARVVAAMVVELVGKPAAAVPVVFPAKVGAR